MEHNFIMRKGERIKSKYHEKYSLENFHKLSNAKNFIQEVRFTLNLEELYTVVDSANYNCKNKFCPVLLKVGPKMLPNVPEPED